MEKGIEDLDFNEEDYGIAQEPSNPNGYVPDYESLEPEKPWMGDENQPQPADGTNQNLLLHKNQYKKMILLFLCLNK